MKDFTALSPRELAPYIQHTLIAVGTTRDETIAHAKEAAEYGFDRFEMLLRNAGRVMTRGQLIDRRHRGACDARQ